MEGNNYSYSSYPDSTTSTPRSREVDCETGSYADEPQTLNNNPNPNNNASNYKVKFMCSYGGKILPRPHDNQLTYVGGDTKILTVDRNIRYNSFFQKLVSLSDSSDVCFKYQLPGEDLDALISVTNDEDLEHMMNEYDRLCRASVKPARLRLFMFPLSAASFGDGESKSERQWFVDALNSVQISSAEVSSPVSVENPDFLFGFDKTNAPAPTKVHDVSAVVAPPANVTEVVRAGSECGSEDNYNNYSNRHVIGEPVVPLASEMQRQIQDFQKMQIAATHEQAVNLNPRAYYGDYYAQKIPQPAQPPPATTVQPYWQEQRHMTMSMAGGDSPVYLIPTSTAVYQAQAPAQALRPATGQVGPGQAYYGIQQRLVNPPEVYREQQVYNALPQQQIGMVRPSAPEHGYGQVYYTTTPGGVAHSYQPVTTTEAVAAEMRPGGGLAANQDGKTFGNPNKSQQNSSL